MEYIYECPKCGRSVALKRKETYIRYANDKLLCYACRDKERNLNYNLHRICPKCGRIITYKWKADYKKACEANSVCNKCGGSVTRFKRGFYRKTPVNTPTYTLDKIRDMSNESFYWLGLIITDGSFYKTCFEIGLREKDYEYLVEFAKYIGYNIEKIKYREDTKSFRLGFCNKDNLKEFKNCFGIFDRKTYNPIDYDKFIKKYTYEQKLSLLIGIIDGDGTIIKNGKTFYIIITAHKSWETFYKKMIDDLGIDFNIRLLKNKNVLRISTGKKENVLKILNFAKENNLIKLKRKWEKINY